jgi:hypothetical protein
MNQGNPCPGYLSHPQATLSRRPPVVVAQPADERLALDSAPALHTARLPDRNRGSEASADASMADGAGPPQDASTDGSRSDSGGDGGSPDSEAAGD